MRTSWAGRLGASWGVVVIVAALCRGEAPGQQAPRVSDTAQVATATPEQVRTETLERLKRLERPAEAVPAVAPVVAKGLREVLEERLHWLDEWDKAANARHDAEHPEPSAERQTAERNADLERVKALLEQSARDPEALLPAVFRTLPGQVQVSDPARAEMKEAIAGSLGERNDWTAKLEKERTDSANANSALPALRVERDKIHQRVTALKSRIAEREAAVAAARTPEEAELASERLINVQWESRVEGERLQVQEAKLGFEATRAALAALSIELFEAHVRLAARTLERMQQRYQVVSERQERSLKQAAANAQHRADRSGDPLEKYRARREAELLELQAQVFRFENELTTNHDPAIEEQRRRADRAVVDFAAVKALLDDGRISHLDALRLNNDFRRIGPERASIVTHELAAAAARLTVYENTLSSVEIDLINESRDDRLQHEDLLERLPQARYPAAKQVFQKIETAHVNLLERKRIALEKLAARAEEVNRQIERRIKTLDDHYGFIRTHIFWVRDQEPIGAVTLAQCRREAAILGRSLFPLVRDACDRSRWGRVSPEFVVASLALLGLPWPLYRLRRALCSGSGSSSGLVSG
jgi:potassium efflux system protein